MSIYFKGKVYFNLSSNVYNPYDPTDDRTRRNAQILAFHNDGISLTTIANQFGISPQRVHQIIQE